MLIVEATHLTEKPGKGPARIFAALLLQRSMVKTCPPSSFLFNTPTRFGFPEPLSSCITVEVPANWVPVLNYDSQRPFSRGQDHRPNKPKQHGRLAHPPRSNPALLQMITVVFRPPVSSSLSLLHKGCNRWHQ